MCDVVFICVYRSSCVYVIHSVPSRELIGWHSPAYLRHNYIRSPPNKRKIDSGLKPTTIWCARYPPGQEAGETRERDAGVSSTSASGHGLRLCKFVQACRDWTGCHAWTPRMRVQLRGSVSRVRGLPQACWELLERGGKRLQKLVEGTRKGIVSSCGFAHIRFSCRTGREAAHFNIPST